MNKGYADLHLHTTASDGTQEISELVERAATHGFSAIAITDHDTISPLLTSPVTMMGGLEVISGVELKVDYYGILGELLGYFLNPDIPAIKSLFLSMEQARKKRMKKMIDRCSKYLGVDITFEEVRRLAKGSIGRPHLAQLLVDKHAAPSLRDAFNKFIADGKPCYIPLDRPGFREATDAIHAAGGVASIPHPCLMSVQDWEQFLIKVHAQGVDGIEAFYPYKSTTDNLRVSPDTLMSLAKKQGLLLTGGSDDHGPGSVKETLGAIELPYHYVSAIKKACASVRD